MSFIKLAVNKIQDYGRHIWQRKSFYLSCIFSIILTLILGHFSQYLFISEFLKRGNAELAAPMIGAQYNSDRDERNLTNLSSGETEIPKITIIKITDEDIKMLGLTYPLSFGYHGRALDAISEHGTPKAIFIDMLFFEPREDFHVLQDALCKLRKKGTKIYIASNMPKRPLTSEFRQITQIARGKIKWPEGEYSCKLLAAEVAVDKTTDKFTNQAWNYCLYIDKSGAKSKDLNNCQITSSTKYGITTINKPAYQIYLDMGYSAINKNNSPELALTWATETEKDPKMLKHDSNQACRNSIKFLDRIALPDIIKKQLDRDSIKPFCPYFNELTMSDFKDSDNQEALIDNNIVFYGSELDGINDFSYTPSRGKMHSMNVHAMALDNLLVYQDNSKFNKELCESKGLLLFVLAWQIFIIALSIALEKVVSKIKFFGQLNNCSCLPQMIHFKSFIVKITLLIFAPFLILLLIPIGYSLLNLGVMSWIEYAAIGSFSEVLGLRKMIEEDLVSLGNWLKKWRSL